MIRYENFILLQDGEKISEDLVSKYNLRELTTRKGEQNFISFVGIVLNRDNTVFSVPKHYFSESFWRGYISKSKNEIYQEVSKLLTLLVRGNSSFSNDKVSNFPIEEYLKIQQYYKKYGLFSQAITIYSQGYSGKIDWKKTIQKSRKLLQNNGMLYLPFQNKKRLNINNFISECMEYVLFNTYKLFSNFLDFLTPYSYSLQNPIFKDYNRCIVELHKIKSRYFKDSEKSLINSLIDYFKWLSKRDNKIVIATQNFELYWEALVAVVLDVEFEDISSNGQIIFNKNNGGVFKFKDKREPIEDTIFSSLQGREAFSIEFDHIRYDNNRILLFDSKYTKQDTIGRFNYKQAFYYYFLKSKYPSRKIFNGLILPTSDQYSYTVHVDRETTIVYDVDSPFPLFYSVNEEKIDGLKIIEHKFNLQDTVEIAIQNMTLLKDKFNKSNFKRIT